MAFYSGFFNSKGLDRTYTAEDFTSYLSSIICNGILDTYGQMFRLTAASSGLKVTLGTGKAWIDGHYFINDARYSIDLTSYQDESLPRYVAIAILLDVGESVRSVSLEITPGTPAENPSLPSLPSDENKTRLLMYAVRLNPGATELTERDWYDYREDKNVCGYCKCILGKCKVTELMSQMAQLIVEVQENNETIAELTNKVEELEAEVEDIGDIVAAGQCGENVFYAMYSNGKVYLPAELHVGAAKMSVFGYDTESDTTVRATTVPVTLNIRPSGFVGDDEPPIPPTPDLYAQLLKKIEEAGHGADGKSAYEIAVEHGYVGTETEWLASLKGEPGETPDMSEYPKTSEVTTIVEREIEAATGDFHTHANKATLDRLTPELMQELSGLQQFEDSTQYEIQTINEELLTLNAQRHTHNNKDVLDSITQEMLDGIASAARQAHSHHNMTTLNGITDSHVERWELAYTSAMNLNERVGVNEGVFERFKTEILYDMQGCRTSISDILNRLSAVETELSGVETALAAIVEVTT